MHNQTSLLVTQNCVKPWIIEVKTRERIAVLIDRPRGYVPLADAG
jgi:hypothetical protein